MPAVNIYCNKKDSEKIWEQKRAIQEFLAEQLSCDDRTLIAQEIDIRPPITSELNTDVKIDIFAQNYEERMLNEDIICENIGDFVKDNIVETEVKAWLWLSEVGHNFKN